MKLRNLLLLAVLAMLSIFVAINWSAIMTPTSVSLLFTTMEVPLGLILLAVTALLIVIFLGFVAYMQSSLIISRQRLMRDLDAQRELANKAEASRFTDLHDYLKNELQQLSVQNVGIHKQLETRLGALESTLTNVVEQTGTTLSAYIGELEDRLEKK